MVDKKRDPEVSLVLQFIEYLNNRTPAEKARDRKEYEARKAAKKAVVDAEVATTVWNLESMKDSECSPANWLSREEDGVPKLGIYVLGRHNRGTWGDSDDQEGVNYVWLKRVLVDYLDRSSNNSTHYRWDPFGPDCFEGQTITHWCYVSRRPRSK